MSHEINHRFPELETYTRQITEIIKDINSNQNLNRNERSQAIKVLSGMTRWKMDELVTKHFKNKDVVPPSKEIKEIHKRRKIDKL
jgi:hypothetical protein